MFTDDVCAEMRHLNVGPNLLSQIFKRFKENRVRFNIHCCSIINVFKKLINTFNGMNVK